MQQPPYCSLLVCGGKTCYNQIPTRRHEVKKSSPQNSAAASFSSPVNDGGRFAFSLTLPISLSLSRLCVCVAFLSRIETHLNNNDDDVNNENIFVAPPFDVSFLSLFFLNIFAAYFRVERVACHFMAVCTLLFVSFFKKKKKKNYRPRLLTPRDSTHTSVA